MRRMLILSKYLLKNNLNLSLKTKKGRRNALLYLVVLLGLMPLGIMFGFTAYSLFEQGFVRQTVLLYTMGQCLINLLMLGLTFPAVFYFSDDNSRLLTLPVSAFDIVAAKTLVVFSSQIYIILLLTVPLLAAFALSAAFSWSGMLALLISQILSILILLAFLGTIWIVVFALFPKAVNKDRFTLISGILGVVFSIAIAVAAQSHPAGDSLTTAQMAGALDGMENAFGFLGWLFWQAPLSAQATAGSFSSFLLLTGLFFLSVSIYMAAARKWYLASAMAAAGTASRRSKAKKKEMNRGPLWKRYVLNDLHVLLRTPAYAYNIVLSSFILPVLMVVLLGMQADEIRPILVELFVRNGEISVPGFPLWALALTAGLFITVFITGTNGCSATALSRMGARGIEWMNTIPMDPGKQVLLKMVPGFILSVLGAQLCVIFIHMLIPYPCWADLFFLAANLLGSLLINEIGILTDLIHPKLIWASEMESMKNNLNVLIDMGISIVILLLAAAAYALLPFVWAVPAVMLLAGLCCWFFWHEIKKRASALLLKEHAG